MLVKSSYAVLALHNMGLTREGPNYPRLKKHFTFQTHVTSTDDCMDVAVEIFSPPIQMHFLTTHPNAFSGEKCNVKKRNGEDKSFTNIV